MSNHKVLVVEDSRVKARAIRECLRLALPATEITETDTIAIAGQLIENQSWNGIVLDLAFQKSQQTADIFNRPYLAGIEILQQLKEMRLLYPVFIATQHASFINTKYGSFGNAAELGAVLGKIFSDNFRGIVEVDLSSPKWREELTRVAQERFV